MRGFSLLLLVAGFPLVANAYHDGVFYDASPKNLSSGASVGSDVAGGDCIKVDDNGVQGCVRTTDAAPNKVLVTGQSAYAQATTNTTGADLAIAAGLGRHKIAMTRANCSTRTVTIYVDGTAHALVENTDWLRGANDNASAANLAATITALTGIEAVAVTNNVYLARSLTEPSALAINVTTNAPTCAAITVGVDGNVLLDSPVVARYLDTAGAADGTRFWDFTVTGLVDPASSATISTIYGAYNRTAATNGTFAAAGVEGVARSQSADEAGTFRGVYGRTYIDGDASAAATARTSIGVEASARASYVGGPEIAAEAGTAFVGQRVWMAPYFSAATVNNVNNFWGIWVYGEHATQRNADAAIKIGSAGGGFTADLNLQGGHTITDSATGIVTDVGATTNATCNGACPAWGHSPTLACEGAMEVDGVLYADGGLTLGGTLDANGQSIINPANIYRSQATTDVAPTSRSFTGQAAYEQATTTSTRTGASRTIAGGLGTRQITTCTTGTGADTYTATVTDTTGTVLSSVVLTAGTSFQCITDGPTCCANFGVAVNASALNTEGVTAVCVGGTPSSANCSDSKVYFRFDPSKVVNYTQAIADVGGGGSFATTVNGGNGQVLIAGNAGSLTAPALSFAAAPGMGINPESSTQLTVVGSGGRIIAFVGGAYTYLYQPISTGGNRLFDATGPLQLGGACSIGSANADVCSPGVISKTTAKGASTQITTGTPTSVTFAGTPGDASKTATGLRVAKRAIRGVSGRVTTAGTNCTSMSIGDGSDPDRYGATIAVTLGSVFDSDDATADPREWLTAAGDVVVTANGGNCFGLVVRLTVHYDDYQADTAN